MTATPTSRKIEHLPLADLHPDPRNPKAHHLDTIDASLGRFGYVEPVVLDGRTGYIVSGHGRVKTLTAMAERGESPPEGIAVDEEGRWLAPVVTGWSSRTDTEAAAALIALNRTTELGGWVDDALLDLLDDLASVDDGLTGVGFTEDDRQALDALLHHVEQPEALDDAGLDDLVGGMHAGESLTIRDVSNADITRFRSIAADSDAARLTRLLDWADEAEGVTDADDDEE